MFTYTPLTFVREIVMILVTAVFALPLYILLVGSMKTTDEFRSTSPLALPTDPQWSNFVEVLTTTGRNSVVAGFVNSVVLTVGSLAIVILLGSFCAYVIVRSTRRWAKASFYLFLVAIILPTQLGVVPLYVGARALGLTGTLIGLILIYSGMFLPLCVFLYASFFRGHPRDYEEAAAIDGAGPFRTYWHSVLPLMAPVTGTVAILAGVAIWNDFFTPLIFLGGSNFPTLPVVMYQYVGNLVAEWNKIFAVVVIAFIPVMIFFIFSQRRLMQGFSGGVKS
ncbi:carbohydrate ABC transporter permease [Herbiconiux sp. KACC 21604]|uniref:carbohydrate ABC transporter permease n=1 Tax=unclassified Herbiconiux TaxID=2618217 RepID=UPI001492116E|nr:carbohydrate ABC transporter permease [Herbiconiux sp. SALV-R1]QJU55667.1 carbohydrate ABC transporter permease [Herbiconiux sp. SALV-R1]WPO86870.1 carbohydrate ABC transporter permease [Herbiconiux sp. KACC 21604]